MRELHLAGAFGIQEVLRFNQFSALDHSWNFPTFFPFREICPGLTLYDAMQTSPHRDAILLVINLNSALWDHLQQTINSYGHSILIQLEAFKGWEAAYENCRYFETFINFDNSYDWHKNFHQIYLPYTPSVASSHLDRRGWRTFLNEWSNSRRRFLDIYLGHFLPRKRKVVMIASMHQGKDYHYRLDAARENSSLLDVFGGGWPKDLANYHGGCVDKINLMKRYRYALVFENQRQPGYVTEKLLDCWASGTIPIYWGAPNVAQMVPDDALIIWESDKQPSNLLDIISLDEKRYQSRYSRLQNTRKDVFSKFDPSRFVSVLQKAISTTPS